MKNEKHTPFGLYQVLYFSFFIFRFSFLIEPQLLHIVLVRFHPCVDVYAEGTRSSGQVTNAVLGFFAFGLARVHLAEGLWFVFAKEVFQNLYGFGFAVHILLLQNGNFYRFVQVWFQSSHVTRADGFGNAVESELLVPDHQGYQQYEHAFHSRPFMG